MNKRGYLIAFVFALILLVPLITAQTDDGDATSQTNLDKAYQCLKDKIGDSCDSLTDEEQIYSLLALGNYKDCKKSVSENLRNEECWPKANCKIKETSLAMVGLDDSGYDTSKMKDWLFNQTKVADNLFWYIQIDADSATTCTINYGSQYSVSISEDKKVSSSAGPCLTISENGYWLKIASSCLENEFKISCDKDFITNLLYRTPDSPIIHVSQITHSESSNGESTEKITYRCFEKAGSCDYESSLWASFALKSTGEDVTAYIPFLTAFKDENDRYFPDAFLYIIEGGNDYLNSILRDNFKTNYWQVGTLGKFQSTAIAFLALQSQSSNEVETTKQYLLDKTQGSNGCFNSNFVDTAFLIYSGWPNGNSPNVIVNECLTDAECSSNEECIDGDCVIPSAENCEAQGKYCVPSGECLSLGGVSFSEYSCTGFTQECCSQDLSTCFELGGEVCSGSKTCSDSYKESSDSPFNCCIGTCETNAPRVEEYTCGVGVSGETCRNECLSGEEANTQSCDLGQTCCEEKTGGSLLWVWILLILIIVVILAIIFRNKLKLLWYRFKSKFRKGPAPRQTRPPFPPSGQGRMIPSSARPVFQRPNPRYPQNFPRPYPQQRPQQRPSQSDKDFEETLKKLKDMSE